MIEFARLPHDKRMPFFEQTAANRHLTRLIVEKDFWVCFILRLLFNTPALEDKFVFKGGTSLSKVFGIINRFSEDIDLSVDPTWLGFGNTRSPDAIHSRSQINKRWKALQQACIVAVEKDIQQLLECAIREVLGLSSSGDSYLMFQVDRNTKSPVLIFRYPTKEHEGFGYIRPQVKLELGSLTDQHPTGKHTVTSWVAKEFPNSFEEPNCSVVALEAERTFWEKATILHKEYHRPKDSPIRNRLSRDCYDLCIMAKHSSGQKALHDIELLRQVVKFKHTFFRSSWSNYESAQPGTFKLVPPEYRLSELKTDYRSMQEMFLEDPPPFDDLHKQLQDLENTINGKRGGHKKE
jgi:hypothetical protein